MKRPSMPFAHMIRAGACIAVLVISALPTEAARLDTRRMTCNQVAGLVQQRGGIVMTTGPRTYERFVANLGSCGPTQRPVDARVPTLDSPSCRVGYRCEEDPFK